MLPTRDALPLKTQLQINRQRISPIYKISTMHNQCVGELPKEILMRSKQISSLISNN